MVGGVVEPLVDDVVELGLAHLAFKKHQFARLVRQPAAGRFHDRVGNGGKCPGRQVETVQGIDRAFGGGVHELARAHLECLEATLGAAVGRYQGLHAPAGGRGGAGQEDVVGVLVAGPYRGHAHGLTRCGGDPELRQRALHVGFARQAGGGRPTGVHRPVQGNEQLPAKAVHERLAGGIEVVDRQESPAGRVEHQLLLYTGIGVRQRGRRGGLRGRQAQ